MPIGPDGCEPGFVVDMMDDRSDRREAAEAHLTLYLRQHFNKDLAQLDLRCREVEYLCWVFYKWSARRGRQLSGQDSGWVVGARAQRGVTAERWEIAEFGNGISAAVALSNVKRLLGRN